MNTTHRLDLITNSISYFREAVKYAQQEAPDTNHWKFAIIHVVQAMELAFKEYLRRIHPAFVFESIDKPDKALSLRGALARIRSPAIGKVAISEKEKGKIEKALDLRNALTHYEFDHEREHTELKFAEIFAFMIFFYKTHLKIEAAQFIEEEQYQRIFKLVKARTELLANAKGYLSLADVGEVWMCRDCFEDTFVVSEAQCCFCHYREEVAECEFCGENTLASDVIETGDLFDWDYDEGRSILLNDYGLPHSACRECISAVRQKVEDLRRAKLYEDLSRELLT
ncbi:hypothetical protein FFK22_017095 [Mycobacterium sp. KBS0706]|uniref:hypothetical protein n=1 Tax=Mycobacterium sp. KBS0706 TaxID=2578109 RepID=UPI00110F83CC|nr:hypothetical protein [Mycobacterium sp. KBS0706]TSD87557.1 hypothetical protein FFK22_017095 [Mycobacterium sp. KBS0706]